MKLKLFIASIACMSLFSLAKAEVIFNILPTTVTPNATEDLDSDDYLELYLKADEPMSALNFELYVPSFITLTDDGIDDGEIWPKKNHLAVMADWTSNSLKEQIEGYNHYQVVIYSSKNNLFTEASGNILYFFYSTPSSIPAGVYPIYIKGKVNNAGVEEDNPSFNPETSRVFVSYPIELTTSYIKVGDPTDENTLALSGVVPSFVTSALNDETAITTLDLSECTAINGDFNLVDKRGVVLPAKGLDANVSYTRSTNTWGTICLPFDVKNSETVKYYTLSAVSVAEGKMTFESVEDDAVITAGTPIVYKSSNGELNLSANKLSGAPASSESKEGFTPTGTFINTTGTGLYIAQNKFWPGSGFQVPAFRSYFASSLSQASSYRIVVDDEVAGISELEMDEKGNLHEVYNLQGQHIAAPINGQVNIIDGKKAIMK